MNRRSFLKSVGFACAMAMAPLATRRVRPTTFQASEVAVAYTHVYDHLTNRTIKADFIGYVDGRPTYEVD